MLKPEMRGRQKAHRPIQNASKILSLGVINHFKTVTSEWLANAIQIWLKSVVIIIQRGLSLLCKCKVGGIRMRPL